MIIKQQDTRLSPVNVCPPRLSEKSTRAQPRVGRGVWVARYRAVPGEFGQSSKKGKIMKGRSAGLLATTGGILPLILLVSGINIAKADDVAGPANVKNELEIAPSKPASKSQPPKEQH